MSAVARELRRLAENGVALGTTSQFVTHLKAKGWELSEHEMHGMLASWGFSQESKRLEQGPRRAWELEDSRLTEIELELGQSPSPSQSVTTLTTSIPAEVAGVPMGRFLDKNRGTEDCINVPPLPLDQQPTEEVLPRP